MVKFSISGQAFTPVPTIFLKEYMCDAPQDYVVVYLYGLHMAYEGGQSSGVEMEEALHMTSAQIEAALKYWVEKGFVQQIGTGANTNYCFLQETPTGGEQAQAAPNPAAELLPVYQHKEYNQQLERLLNRQLLPADLTKLHDYTDVFGLPQEVVVKMIEHVTEARGRNVSIAYLDKVAQNWADEGIDSTEKMQQKIEDYQAMNSGARAVLRQMGIRGKSPDKTQMDLYNKWTEDWGFTQESIQFAMKDVEFSSGSPFKYLDAILRNLYEQGITTSSGISQYTDDYESRQENIKDVLRAMDYSRIYVRPSHERFYEEWVQAGCTHEMIVMASKQALESNAPRRFDSVDALLKEWSDKGLGTAEDITQHTKQQDGLLKQIQQVYDCAGITKEIGDADRSWYITCRQEHRMSHDVLMYAAEISSLANTPIAFMRKVIADWAEKEIITLEKAMEQNLNHISKDMKNENSFEQHEYTEDDLLKRRRAAMKIVENPDE